MDFQCFGLNFLSINKIKRDKKIQKYFWNLGKKIRKTII